MLGQLCQSMNGKIPVIDTFKVKIFVELFVLVP